MGVSFRKGIKLDSGRVNLSKSRIGFSTGVKGARVGINSRGKLYSSVGRHGIYYRKTYGTKRRAKSSSSSGLGSLIFLGLIIFVFVKIFGYIAENPKVLFIPAGIFLLWIIYKLALLIFHKRTEKYIKIISNVINEKDYEKLTDLVRKIGRNRKIVYEMTYYNFLLRFLSERDATEEINYIFKRYRKYLSFEITEAEDERFFGDLLLKKYSQNDFTSYDANHIVNLCTYLSMPEDFKIEVENEVQVLQKVFDIRKNGLKELHVQSPITENKQCYYEGDIQILKARSSEGELYYEDDKEGKIYITNDGLNFVYDGHKKIKFNEIIKSEIVDNVLRLSVVNRQKPLGFYSKEQRLILEIINKLK